MLAGTNASAARGQQQQPMSTAKHSKRTAVYGGTTTESIVLSSLCPPEEIKAHSQVLVCKDDDSVEQMFTAVLELRGNSRIAAMNKDFEKALILISRATRMVTEVMPANAKFKERFKRFKKEEKATFSKLSDDLVEELKTYIPVCQKRYQNRLALSKQPKPKPQIAHAKPQPAEESRTSSHLFMAPLANLSQALLKSVSRPRRPSENTPLDEADDVTEQYGVVGVSRKGEYQSRAPTFTIPIVNATPTPPRVQPQRRSSIAKNKADFASPSSKKQGPAVDKHLPSLPNDDGDGDSDATEDSMGSGQEEGDGDNFGGSYGQSVGITVEGPSRHPSVGFLPSLPTSDSWATEKPGDRDEKRERLQQEPPSYDTTPATSSKASSRSHSRSRASNSPAQHASATPSSARATDRGRPGRRETVDDLLSPETFAAASDYDLDDYDGAPPPAYDEVISMFLGGSNDGPVNIEVLTASPEASIDGQSTGRNGAGMQTPSRSRSRSRAGTPSGDSDMASIYSGLWGESDGDGSWYSAPSTPYPSTHDLPNHKPFIGSSDSKPSSRRNSMGEQPPIVITPLTLERAHTQLEESLDAALDNIEYILHRQNTSSSIGSTSSVKNKDGKVKNSRDSSGSDDDDEQEQEEEEEEVVISEHALETLIKINRLAGFEMNE